MSVPNPKPRTRARLRPMICVPRGSWRSAVRSAASWLAAGWASTEDGTTAMVFGVPLVRGCSAAAGRAGGDAVADGETGGDTDGETGGGALADPPRITPAPVAVAPPAVERPACDPHAVTVSAAVTAASAAAPPAIAPSLDPVAFTSAWTSPAPPDVPPVWSHLRLDNRFRRSRPIGTSLFLFTIVVRSG